MNKKTTLIIWIFMMVMLLLIANHWSNNLDKLETRLEVNKQEISKLKKEIKQNYAELKAKNNYTDIRLIDLESQPK